MPVGDVYEMAIRGTYQGEQVITTHHFEQMTADASLAIDTDPPVALHGQWVDHGHGEWLDLMPKPASVGGGYTLDDVLVRRVVPFGAIQPATRIFPHGDAGLSDGGVNECLAPWITAHVTVRTATAGRSFRGRFFTSGIFVTDLSGPDTLHPGDGYYLAKLLSYCGTTGLAAFLSGGLAATDWRLAVFSRRRAGYPAPRRSDGTPAVTITPPAAASSATSLALSLEPHLRAGSLRSRRVRG